MSLLLKPYGVLYLSNKSPEHKTIKKVSSKKVWITGMTHPHVEPLPIPIIQEVYDGKSHKDFVKLKLRRDPTSSTSELYEFLMSLFDNGKPEEFYCSFVSSI